MPYPNEHSCRLGDPEKFEEGSFRRIRRGNLAIIIGRRQGKETTEAQAYRYPVKEWTEAEARAHCTKAGGKFEPATEEGKAMGEISAVEVDGVEVGVEELVAAYKALFDFDMDMGMEAKFVGSPRNPYGTHSSKGYPGGRAGWQKAWRVYLSQVRSQGPIQGTIRRVSMIAAAMKPVCTLPEMSAEDVGPRTGGEGSLAGEVKQTPKDYGLTRWKKPSEDDLTQEDIGLTCQDLKDLKKLCLQEIAKRIQKREKEEEKAAVKMLREEDGGAVVGGYLLLWGSPERTDLQADYFTPETDLMLEHYKSAPALFHHGLDDTVGLAVLGHRVKAEQNDVGVWVEDWLDTSNRYWEMVRPLLEAEVLYYSPGSAPHLVKRAEDGRLESYPVVEDTLTVVPAQHRLRSVEQIKAAYKAAGLELPEGLEPAEPEQRGDDAGAACAEAMAGLARAEMVLAEIDEVEM